jgi:hypothetical protein
MPAKFYSADRPQSNLVETVNISWLAVPFRLISWSNLAILYAACAISSGFIFSAVLGKPGAWISAVLTAAYAFPAWVAWKNITVVSAVAQPLTVTSFLWVSGVSTGVSLVLLSSQLDDYTRAALPLYFALAVLPLGAALSMFVVRRLIIRGVGLNLRSVYGRLFAGSVLKHVRPTPREPLRGLLCLAGAFAALLSAPAILEFGPQLFGPLFGSDRESFFVQSTVGLLQTVAFILLFNARAYFHPSAASLLEKDVRKPVLLLRSFSDDRENAFWATKRRAGWGGIVELARVADPSLEARLASQLAHIGPFIGVGDPTDPLPAIGAARVNLGEADWQSQVAHWIDESTLLILFQGRSHWIDWELKEVISRNAVGKLLVCLPEISKLKREIDENASPFSTDNAFSFSTDMEVRLIRLRDTFSDTLWTGALNSLADAKTLRAMVFIGGGSIFVVRSHSRSRNAYHLAALIALWKLRTSSPAPQDGGAAFEGNGTAAATKKAKLVWTFLGAILLMVAGLGLTWSMLTWSIMPNSLDNALQTRWTSVFDDASVDPQQTRQVSAASAQAIANKLQSVGKQEVILVSVCGWRCEPRRFAVVLSQIIRRGGWVVDDSQTIKLNGKHVVGLWVFGDPEAMNNGTLQLEKVPARAKHLIDALVAGGISVTISPDKAPSDKVVLVVGYQN